MASVHKRWRSKDGLWLSLAIALHVLVLMIPTRQEAPTTTSIIPLNIRLLAPPAIDKPFVEDSVQLKDEYPATENVTDASALPEKPELASQENVESSPPHARIREEVIPGTARLLDSASELDWPLPAVENFRRLGVFVPQALPENWRPGIKIEDKLFNGTVLPGKTEIVDRWLSVDGTQNVVINTPGGNTLCGRVEAWDPMQALDERLMHFRPCGGGGRRTFEINKRPLYDRVITPVANSTIN